MLPTFSRTSRMGAVVFSDISLMPVPMPPIAEPSREKMPPVPLGPSSCSAVRRTWLSPAPISEAALPPTPPAPMVAPMVLPNRETAASASATWLKSSTILPRIGGTSGMLHAPSPSGQGEAPSGDLGHRRAHVRFGPILIGAELHGRGFPHSTPTSYYRPHTAPDAFSPH